MSDELTVRYFAAARAATGLQQEQLAGAATLAELTATLTARHGDRLATVLKVASFLVNESAWHDRLKPLPPGATVDVLPPFAGG